MSNSSSQSADHITEAAPPHGVAPAPPATDDGGPARAARADGQGLAPGPAPGPAPQEAQAPPARRLGGVDVARGLAVLGMFIVHVGIGWTLADGSNALYPIAAGRSAVLFALLAGVSIALLSGGRERKVNKDLGVALWRVITRGVVMLFAGTALTMLGTSVSVILAYYAVFFVLAGMVLTERWGVVAFAAAVLGVAGPVASYWLRGVIAEGGTPGRVVGAVNAYDPFVLLADDGIVNFLLTGYYPAITWMPFVFAGLAIGRLDLRSTRVRWRLVALGSGLAAAAYGVSWVVLDVLGGVGRLAASVNPETGAAYGADGVALALYEGLPGVVPPTDWVWLFTAAPHSGTPLEVFGSGGVAIAVLGLCLLVSDRLGWLVYPVASVGALALTVYVGHILVIWLDERSLLDGTPLSFVSTWLDLSVPLGALVFATAWRLLVRRRGPLEWPLHVVSSWVAERIP
ncbi:heparan-alpha-glucosaminide N-acetyltransferase domain-containing protein [Actinorugispora endophytica]|uniref:heparan-alpha-glucosaminide N-acetyltransferase domain-containing protein n=1 Tax=Actinorugispora endophytica TaxID=1605990 RepID=UPI001FB7834F|nr:heparan-alpha-glucosaminide N-acetyltransferase domain-containing protein [Actinorugispora endophytica]